GQQPPLARESAFHVTNAWISGSKVRNQSPRLAVPWPSPPLPSRARLQDRTVTANVSVPSVGDVSGRRLYIEDVYPRVDAGRFAVKRVVGEPLEVWADIYRDGHAALAADLVWRPETSDKWS